MMGGRRTRAVVGSIGVWWFVAKFVIFTEVAASVPGLVSVYQGRRCLFPLLGGELSVLPFPDYARLALGDITVRHLIRKGRFEFLLNAFMRVVAGLRFTGLSGNVFVQMSRIIRKRVYVPYRVSVIKSSNRYYFFPLPVRMAWSVGFVYKRLSLLLQSTPGIRCGLHERLGEEFGRFLFGDNSSRIFVAVREYLRVGYQNRMFTHYRWRFRR